VLVEFNFPSTNKCIFNYYFEKSIFYFIFHVTCFFFHCLFFDEQKVFCPNKLLVMGAKKKPCSWSPMFMFTISLASCFTMGKAHRWRTFPKCEVKFNYNLILSPLYKQFPHFGASPCTNDIQTSWKKYIPIAHFANSLFHDFWAFSHS